MHGGDSIPVEMTMLVRRGDPAEVERADFIAFDEVVIPVELVVQMTPALQATLRRAGAPPQRPAGGSAPGPV